MKTTTIVCLLLIGLVAIHHNSVQAEEDPNFEEGKFSSLSIDFLRTVLLRLSFHAL